MLFLVSLGGNFHVYGLLGNNLKVVFMPISASSQNGIICSPLSFRVPYLYFQQKLWKHFPLFIASTPLTLKCSCCFLVCFTTTLSSSYNMSMHFLSLSVLVACGSMILMSLEFPLDWIRITELENGMTFVRVALTVFLLCWLSLHSNVVHHCVAWIKQAYYKHICTCMDPSQWTSLVWK